MSLLQSVISKESLKILEQSLSFSPTKQDYEKAEQAWKALSVWRKIRSKKKYITKKAWEFYQSRRFENVNKIGNTITIRKPKRYETK